MRVLLFGTERYAIPILVPLADALGEQGHDARWYLHGIGRGTAADASRIFNARDVKAFAPDIVFCAANWVPPFFSGLKVQVFHGFSIDKRDAARGHFRIRGQFDLYCTQGPSTTVPFEDLAREHQHFRVVETGWPKLDPLFAPHGHAAALALIAPAHGRRVVMFGSTFTPRLSAAPHLFDAIRTLIEQGRWYFLLTLHPKCDAELVARYRSLEGPNARFIESEQVVTGLRAADVLVADTSSIVAEFAVQRRPVVTFRNRRPQPHMIDIDEPAALEPSIERAMQPTPDLVDALAAYADDIHPYRDGRSSERVIAAALDSLTRGNADLKRKPLNLGRAAQAWWRIRKDA